MKALQPPIFVKLVASAAILVAISTSAALLLPIALAVPAIVATVGIQLLLLAPTRVADQVSLLERQIEGMRRTTLYDANLGLYQAWYFDIRLREEAERCRRYHLPMAVIIVSITQDKGPHVTEDSLNVQLARAAYLTAHAVRTVDLSAALGTGEFGLCLVHCDHAGATVALARLEDELAGYDCRAGFAIYPDDSTDVADLVSIARRRAAQTTRSLGMAG